MCFRRGVRFAIFRRQVGELGIFAGIVGQASRFWNFHLVE